MTNITITFDEFGKHRMPQYSMRDYNVPINQEEERDIWLRIPVTISNENFRVSFFIQSKIEISKITSFGPVEDVAYFISATSFSKRISEVTKWDVLSMQDFYPIYNFDLELLKNGLPEELPHKFETNITEQFDSYLKETSMKIDKACEAIELCKENLGRIVRSSSASGFKYIEGEIRQYLNYLDSCARNMSTHSHATHYFKKNLWKIKNGFEELIKRKQVKNWNYQYHLEEARTALFMLSRPEAWDGRIPEPPVLPDY